MLGFILAHMYSIIELRLGDMYWRPSQTAEIRKKVQPRTMKVRKSAGLLRKVVVSNWYMYLKQM